MHTNTSICVFIAFVWYINFEACHPHQHRYHFNNHNPHLFLYLMCPDSMQVGHEMTRATATTTTTTIATFKCTTYRRRSRFIRVEQNGAKNEMTSVQLAATLRQTVCMRSRNSQQQVDMRRYVCIWMQRSLAQRRQWNRHLRSTRRRCAHVEMCSHSKR